jgi:hypothetical protein
MTNLKNVLSVGLAAATLVVFLTVTISGGALRAGLAPWPGIGAIVPATLAFVVSWKHRSFLVAGLLAASGVTGIIAGVINTQYFAVIVFPGPHSRSHNRAWDTRARSGKGHGDSKGHVNSY